MSSFDSPMKFSTPMQLNVDRPLSNIFTAVATFALVSTRNDSILKIAEPIEYVNKNCKLDSISANIQKTKSASEFLANKPKLNIFLDIVAVKIEEYFGKVPLYLEMSDDGYLLLLIAVSYSPKDAVDKLHEFNQDWWFDNDYLTDDLLSIDVVSI